MDAKTQTVAARPVKVKGYARWPVIPLAGAAFVAIWGGWVDLGRMAGFGTVNLLPGIADVRVDLAITLPLGMEVYAAYAMGAWLTSRPMSTGTRQFAMWSALAALVFGAVGQVAYHLMVSLGIETAPWQIVVVVASIPVAVLGMGSALAHQIHADEQRRTTSSTSSAATGETPIPPEPAARRWFSSWGKPKAEVVADPAPAPATDPVAPEPIIAAAPVTTPPVRTQPRTAPTPVVPGEIPSALIELRDWVIGQVSTGGPVTGGEVFRAGKATSERVARRNLNTLREAAPEIFEGSLHFVPTTRELAL